MTTRTEQAAPTDRQTNWAGNHTYAHARWAAPTSVDEVADLVRGSRAVRVVGSRHSFNAICDSEDLLLDLGGLAADPHVDLERRVATVTPGTRFGEVAHAVAQAGLALPNMGSLPHISVVGAVSAGTHGSGAHQQVLAAAVSRVRLLHADGSVSDHRRGEAGFDGLAVGLGAFGVVLEVDLDLVPSFSVLQTRELVPWGEALPTVEDLLTSAYSVSVFTRYGADEPAEVQRKAVVEDGAPPALVAGASPASILLGDGANLTVLDRPVAWHDGLPHFRLDHQPSFGEEIQSEFFVPREHTAAALEALTEHAEEIRGPMVLSEVRSIAADAMWLSPAQGRDTTALHFTWVRDSEAVDEVNRVIARVLAPYATRPHWGKVWDERDFDLAALYPRLPDFRALAAQHDPGRTFANAFVRRVLDAG